MSSPPLIRTLWIIALTVLVFSSSKPVKSKPRTDAKPVEVIRVGITEYAKIQRTYANYERLFTELATSADNNASVKFNFAVGTYGEVLDWYNKRMIDVAILSAMPVGDLMLAGDANNLSLAYIGRLSVTPAHDPESPPSILSLFSDLKVDPQQYRTGLIALRKDPELEALANDPDALDKMKTMWDQGELKILFVRPYSLSGYIAPLNALKKHGIDPLSRQEQMDFTYDHGESLTRLLNEKETIGPRPAKHVVAFVLDDTRYPRDSGIAKPEDAFTRIKVAELDKFLIPREMVLANYHEERDEIIGSENRFTRTKAVMENLFANWNARVEKRLITRAPNAPEIRWSSHPDWQSYQNVANLLDTFGLPRELLLKATFDDLLDDLSSSESPRLALVLSGGGAKCAYQAGAIVAIENKLQQKFREKAEELRRKGASQADIDQLRRELDIHLVVGTSGGAINALLVALGVTKDVGASHALEDVWQSFKQEQFLQPSVRFRTMFGMSFGILQALLITVAVGLFGGRKMPWVATAAGLTLIALLQGAFAWYFKMGLANVVWLILIEAIVLILSIGLIRAANFALRIWERRPPKPVDAKTVSPETVPESFETIDARRKSRHWRRLTVIILLTVGLAEFLFPHVSGSENLLNYLPDNHWVEHAWTAIILLTNWSYPYPLIIGLAMAAIGCGWKIIVIRRIRDFDWSRWSRAYVWFLAFALIVISTLLVLEGFFRESSPSKAIGIEQAFLEKIPYLIQRSVKQNFTFTQVGDSSKSLQVLSEQIMHEHLLQRDLIITNSKLPAKETTDLLPVNSLPDDLYFYYRSKEENLKPPPDRSFIPLKHNEGKLLDVVIGSSTIYPIFPSRKLTDVYPGNEETRFEKQKIVEMRIIDGGFIHNIPIEAARLWGATHIIVIEASPIPVQREPRVFWDHLVTAFGYLFSQAQRTDMLTLGQEAEAFELRPTSKCEKFNVKSVCTDQAEPDMDTFDFSKRAMAHAFTYGAEDVRSKKPLFLRITGAPHWFNATRPRRARGATYDAKSSAAG
jgi:predicted acylesterase/phospholipase RssA/ABC-type phosphate/phosphonate transport system substrate-binding protein